MRLILWSVVACGLVVVARSMKAGKQVLEGWTEEEDTAHLLDAVANDTRSDLLAILGNQRKPIVNAWKPDKFSSESESNNSVIAPPMDDQEISGSNNNSNDNLTLREKLSKLFGLDNSTADKKENSPEEQQRAPQDEPTVGLHKAAGGPHGQGQGAAPGYPARPVDLNVLEGLKVPNEYSKPEKPKGPENLNASKLTEAPRKREKHSKSQTHAGPATRRRHRKSLEAEDTKVSENRPRKSREMPEPPNKGKNKHAAKPMKKARNSTKGRDELNVFDDKLPEEPKYPHNISLKVPKDHGARQGKVSHTPMQIATVNTTVELNNMTDTEGNVVNNITIYENITIAKNVTVVKNINVLDKKNATLQSELPSTEAHGVPQVPGLPLPSGAASATHSSNTTTPRNATRQNSSSGVAYIPSGKGTIVIPHNLTVIMNKEPRR